jgi:PIN domain nuclease of toxin-antitoxin system
VLLLDTHAILWLDGGMPMAPAAIESIEKARVTQGVLVSPVSAWEIGTLVRKCRPLLDSSRWLGSSGSRQWRACASHR